MQTSQFAYKNHNIDDISVFDFVEHLNWNNKYWKTMHIFCGPQMMSTTCFGSMKTKKNYYRNEAAWIDRRQTTKLTWRNDKLVMTFYLPSISIEDIIFSFTKEPKWRHSSITRAITAQRNRKKKHSLFHWWDRFAYCGF